MSYFSDKILSFLYTQINCQWKNGFCGIVEMTLWSCCKTKYILHEISLSIEVVSVFYSGKIFVEMRYSELFILF